MAKGYIAQLEKAHVFKGTIVTKVENGKAFHPAEAYHQDFLVRNPTYPYIVINDLPTVDAPKRMFPDLYLREAGNELRCRCSCGIGLQRKHHQTCRQSL